MANSNGRQKLKDDFREKLQKHTDKLCEAVSTEDGDWIIKGFIDIARNIYTISVDTKVVSKIMELLIFPYLSKFAEDNKMKLVLSKEQNFYPDITYIDSNGNKYAIDIKSTYRKNGTSVNGMTLGAFTGYFRDRTSTKNITYPYNDYVGHFVLGLIYSRCDEKVDEERVYQIDDLKNITSVIKDFEFFVQEKYRIAVARPGSGNTKNIGSVTKISDLKEGKGPFAELGEELFDDYWMCYLTKDMAKAIDLTKPHYTNLEEYKKFKNLDKKADGE